MRYGRAGAAAADLGCGGAEVAVAGDGYPGPLAVAAGGCNQGRAFALVLHDA